MNWRRILIKNDTVYVRIVYQVFFLKLKIFLYTLFKRKKEGKKFISGRKAVEVERKFLSID